MADLPAHIVGVQEWGKKLVPGTITGTDPIRMTVSQLFVRVTSILGEKVLLNLTYITHLEYADMGDGSRVCWVHITDKQKVVMSEEEGLRLELTLLSLS